LLTKIEEKVAAPKPVFVPVPLLPAEVQAQPVPEPAHVAQIDEPAAGEMTERIIREAIAAATIAADQASRHAAQAVAMAVVQDALDRYRAEQAAERIERHASDTTPSVTENTVHQWWSRHASIY